MRHLSSPGDLIDGRYLVGRVLGRGSMADVYEAVDQKRGRSVAVKVLRRTLNGDAEALERLQREARVQEMISNPHVAAIYGGGVTQSGSPYLVVELMRGRSLRDVIRADGRLGPVRAASYCWQALEGLAAIHQVGVLHRDLKPANMMLEPSNGPVERVVLIDFGFASLEGGRRLTAAGHVVGSLAYLAPERLLGEPGDERSDLYAVGVILYEALVGRRPFVAQSDIELMNLHLDSQPLPPRVACPEARIPEQVERVVMQALSKKPAQREPSARHMAARLEEAAQHSG